LIEQETPEKISDCLIEVVSHRLPQRFGLDPMMDIQVLTPMNRGGLGARALNELLQQFG
jgi:exodeoxyribonuclease V alpha subunit